VNCRHAARRLGARRSVISRHVRDIENELGADLFHRQRHRRFKTRHNPYMAALIQDHNLELPRGLYNRAAPLESGQDIFDGSFDGSADEAIARYAERWPG